MNFQPNLEIEKFLKMSAPSVSQFWKSQILYFTDFTVLEQANSSIFCYPIPLKDLKKSSRAHHHAAKVIQACQVIKP